MSLEILRNFDSCNLLASRAAQDLAAKVLDLLPKQSVNLVLTGGTVGIKTLAELAPHLTGKDLSSLHFWWGDDRFVEEHSQERNYVQAAQVLISKISIPASNLHQIPAAGNLSLIESASEFAGQLEQERPKFDIVLLGMGADGHVASLFPESRPKPLSELVVAEQNSPKPPALRISLSYQALSGADEVWFLVSGLDKADAVSRVFTNQDLPASRVKGKKLTRWYLDTQAASKMVS
jgi:6-phosphogluconolactonase